MLTHLRDDGVGYSGSEGPESGCAAITPSSPCVDVAGSEATVGQVLEFGGAERKHGQSCAIGPV